MSAFGHSDWYWLISIDCDLGFSMDALIPISLVDEYSVAVAEDAGGRSECGRDGGPDDGGGGGGGLDGGGGGAAPPPRDPRF